MSGLRRRRASIGHLYFVEGQNEKFLNKNVQPHLISGSDSGRITGGKRLVNRWAIWYNLIGIWSRRFTSVYPVGGFAHSINMSSVSPVSDCEKKPLAASPPGEFSNIVQKGSR